MEEPFTYYCQRIPKDVLDATDPDLLEVLDELAAEEATEEGYRVTGEREEIPMAEEFVERYSIFRWPVERIKEQG